MKHKHPENKNPIIQSILEHLAEERILPEMIDLWPAVRVKLAASKNPPKEIPMKNRIIVSALAAVMGLAIVAVVVTNSVTTVSAKEILDRAYEVQTQPAATNGIQHIRTKIYGNLEAQPEEQGLGSTIDKYLDLQSGNFRLTVIDNQTGRLTDVYAYDGSNAYSSESTKGAQQSAARLTLYRTPQNLSTLGIGSLGNGNGGLNTKALFDKMRSDPQVQLAGEETWETGRTVYVLRSEQPVRVLIANEAQSPNGIVDVYFDVATYELVGNRVTIQKDGKELLIGLQRILVSETLPEGSSVVWNLSDLEGVNIVDDTNGEHSQPEVISAGALATRIPSAYLLRTVPDSFSLEVNVLPKQFAKNRSGNGPFFYEAGYLNQAGGYFIIRAFDNKKLEDTSWADEIYTTASGLVLYFVNQPSLDPKFTGGLMEAPNGHTYAIDSTLPRDQVKALMEELVLVK